jgi:hypothetical protein
MKTLILFLSLLLISFSVFPQKKIPTIKARSPKVFFIEGEDGRRNWTLNPALKPNEYTITKTVGAKWIKVYTDIDSIKIRLKPNERFDFVVLVNEKDTCYTRIESPPLKDYSRQKPETHDTIPFVLTEFNNLKLKAVLNKIDTLDLKFDSGTTGLLLTNEAIKNKTHLEIGDEADNRLAIGNMFWDSLRVYPVELSGQGTDGRFGWDLFDGKIVEIDYDKNIFIVHSRLSKIDKTYLRFEIEYTHTLFCIQAELQVKDIKYPNRFLFDNGYQRTIMLDTVLMKEQHYPEDLEIIKKVIMRNGQGKEIPVITVNNERLNLGRQSLFNIPVQLLTTGNPARFTTHILGNEVLKRFNTILDFQHNYVYLKPNGLIDQPYQEAKPKS